MQHNYLYIDFLLIFNNYNNLKIFTIYTKQCLSNIDILNYTINTLMFCNNHYIAVVCMVLQKPWILEHMDFLLDPYST